MHLGSIGISAAITLFSALATVSNAQGAVNRAVAYINYASGLVDAGNVTIITSTAFLCGMHCRNQGICSAFSVSKLPSSANDYECIISFGTFTWTPNTQYSLFMEDIGPMNGYTLATDGRFYKYYADAQVPKLARAACIQDGGNLAVPYPGHVRLIIKNTIAATAGDYFVGITNIRNNSTNSTWVTDDGAIFSHTNKSTDPNQAWRRLEPTGSGIPVVMDVNGTWNDVNNLSKMPRMCRRFSYYTQSPVTGKYHKVHYKRQTQQGAAAVCSSEGGALANIYGVHTNWQAVRGYKEQLKTVNNITGMVEMQQMWVAGTDIAQEGIWTFPDGSIMDIAQNATDPMQQYWSSAFTSNTSQNCLTMAQNQINDFYCDFALKFLCEIVV